MSLRIILSLVISLLFIDQINAEANIRIVGSKTLYYFLTFIVEDYSKLHQGTSLIVEASGSGSGINLFCTAKADIAASSREISKEEREFCKKQNINNIEELILGQDGIVFVTSKESRLKDLSLNNIYKAIIAKLPLQNQLVANFYNRWKEIDNSLPDQQIKIYGPYLSSGTKQILMEKLAQDYCLNDEVYNINIPDEKARLKTCMASRKDSRYIELGENQNLLLQKIMTDQESIGILNYSHINQYKNKVKMLSLNNIMPNQETINQGRYPLSRNLYLYYNAEEISNNSNLKDFIFYIKNSDLLGPKGYLMTKGLVYK